MKLLVDLMEAVDNVVIAWDASNEVDHCPLYPNQEMIDRIGLVSRNLEEAVDHLVEVRKEMTYLPTV